VLRTSVKILRLSFYSLLVIAGVVFAASNHARVDLTFWPLPYSLSVPMFMVAIVLFAMGALTAWVILRYATFKERLQHRKTTKRMQALENEIAALRSEQMAREQQLAYKPLSLAK
jgi:uncharacterized integral membrane protein